ncbi:uncharacterized protein LOC106172142 [Lingula anatina]|uniref:Uncharacterized protein LOC106172142 n=1 Tax=Lingula anatina TaxID=7574 RepID=A0A1S3JD07_LINAN|nr:uncharacterized protein LOC106172142 [Lingula anatina]|eukprot:XP_013408208.1 uncharacterized protein LOC106172142 [Lingula anatina]
MQKLWIALIFWAFALIKARSIPSYTFKSNGRLYRAPVYDRDTYSMSVTPETPDSDRVIIIHDYTTNITVYKDISATTCLISPFYPEVLEKDVLLLKMRRGRNGVRESGAIFLVAEMKLTKEETQAFGIGARLCLSYPAFLVRRSSQSPRHTKSTTDKDSVPSIGRVYVDIRFAR